MVGEARNQGRRDRELGLDRDITRRDFVGSTLVGSGMALLGFAAPGCRGTAEDTSEELLGMDVPDWGSYGGIGDYAESYGNTEAVVAAAHPVRTGQYRELDIAALDTGEVYDLVVVGGGFAGLSAALEFKRTAADGQTCLLLDNHPIFGGEAKRNEMLVDGVRLMGPQGSNGTVVLDSDPIAEMHEVLGIPTELEFAEWGSARHAPLEVPRDNYAFLLWGDNSDANGYFFGDGNGSGSWAHNIWWRGMEGTPYSESVRQEMLRWRTNTERPYEGDDFEVWLDSMSYQHYLEEVLGLGPDVARFQHDVLASGLGLGADAISAYRAYASGHPGFDGFAAADRYSYMPPEPPGFETMPWVSFPGGNTGIARYFARGLINGAIPGDGSLENVITGPVDFEALDRPGQPVRMRLGSTVVHLRHDSATPRASEHVIVGYTHDGVPRALRAKAVVVAGGSWMSRNIVVDAPDELLDAWARMNYASILSVNVALTNWRPMHELGITAARWFEGFGFSGNIRRPMKVGGYQAPLDPDLPTMFTMYVPFTYPGIPVRQQGQLSRLELLNTPYVEYERQIREQMLRLFGMAGFDPANDIAGIVLNRWGHAYVVGEPGFHFSTPTRTAPPDVIRRGHGRIRFGHSELNGHQHWPGAVIEGRRAAREAMEWS